MPRDGAISFKATLARATTQLVSATSVSQATISLTGDADDAAGGADSSGGVYRAAGLSSTHTDTPAARARAKAAAARVGPVTVLKLGGPGAAHAGAPGSVMEDPRPVPGSGILSPEDQLRQFDARVQEVTTPVADHVQLEALAFLRLVDAAAHRHTALLLGGTVRRAAQVTDVLALPFGWPERTPEQQAYADEMLALATHARTDAYMGEAVLAATLSRGPTFLALIHRACTRAADAVIITLGAPDTPAGLPVRAFRPTKRAMRLLTLGPGTPGTTLASAVAAGVGPRTLLREVPVIVHASGTAQLLMHQCARAAPPHAAATAHAEALAMPPRPLTDAAQARLQHTLAYTGRIIGRVGKDLNAITQRREAQQAWFRRNQSHILQWSEAERRQRLAARIRTESCFQPYRGDTGLPELIEIAAAEDQAATLCDLVHSMAIAETVQEIITQP